MKTAYLVITSALVVLTFLFPGTWLVIPLLLGCALVLWERWHLEAVTECALRQSRADEETIQAQQAQVEFQQERFRRLVDNSPAAIFQFDRSLSIIYANRVFAETMGTDLQTLLEFNLSRSQDHCLEVCCREVLEGRNTHYEGPYLTTIAHLQLYIDVACTPVIDMDGNVSGGIAILRDVTEHNRLLRELKVVRDQYAELVGRVPVGIYTFRFLSDKRMRFDFVSSRLCKLVGIEREALLADSSRAIDAIHPEDRLSFKQANEQASRTLIPFQWEGRFLVEERVRWIQIKSEGFALDDGSSVWNGVVTDVTERHQSEQALRESEESFRDLFQKMPLPMYLFDSDSLRILMVNQAAVDLYGYSAEDFLGMTLYDVRGEEIEREQYIRLSPDTNGTFRGARKQKCRDGRVFDADLVVRELVLDGVSVGMGVARDVTADRKAQTELLEAKGQAEKASLAKSEFLATMSHEVRTPMNGVLGLLQIAIAQEADSTQKSRLRKAHGAGRALLDILNDVLDYSRIEAGHLVLENIEFDPAKEVRSVADLFEADILAKGVLFELDIAPETPRAVGGDPHRLKQILSNILGNAAKFTLRGKIRMEAFARIQGGGSVELRFAVRDTGIGIPRERIDQLFQPFQQGDSGITRRFGGTGLGLAISRDLVERMGGRITVESEEGKGSVFQFSVPLRLVEGALAPDSQAPVDDVSEDSSLARRRVLLVEDNPLNQEVAKILLESAGYEIVVAGDGRECLDILERERFDAILMDLHMPVMGGLEATRKLRYLPNGANVPVVGLTADVRASVVQECLQAGMVAHVAKPFDPRRLLELLRKLTASGRLASEA